MGLDDRLWFLMIGAAIGFVLGYITRALREIKEELHDVENIVKKGRDESGFMRFPIVADVALIIVLSLTVYAAVASQKASNEVREAQDRIDRIVKCNRAYLADVLFALNERSTYSVRQVEANVMLQQEQADLLEFLLTEPPPSAERGRQVLQEYLETGVLNFIRVNSKSIKKYRMNPYPTGEELYACMMGK